MQKKRNKIMQVITCSGAMVAYLIGSGYATGQEIMQFFTSFGSYSFGALAISFVIMAMCSAIIMEDSCRLGLSSTNSIFRYYCGVWLGRAMTLFIPFLLYSIFVIMISGAGATMSEYYGVNPYIGRIIMSILSAGTAVLGLNKLINIIGRIGPVIIAFSVAVGIISFLNRDIPLMESSAVAASMQTLRAAKTWWLSGFLYSAFCVTTAVSFFANVGTQADSPSSARLSGFIGGAVFIGAAVIMNLGLLSHAGELSGKEIPVLYIAKCISPVLGLLFSIVLICGIYTTAVPMLWSTVHLMEEDGTQKARILCVILTAVAFVCGLLPFDRLVATIYPFSGYVGTVLIAGIFFSKIKHYLQKIKFTFL